MAKKFLTPLGLVGLASDPATGSEGQLYFNTTDDVVRVYANGEWTELSGAGGESASVYYQTEAPEGAPLGALWVDSDSTGTGGTGGGTSGTSLLYWTEDNNGNLLPDLDNVYSVGSSAYRVKDLYLGASSLYLQNPASASANISLSVDSSGNLKINDSKIITESNANNNLNLTNYATLEYAQSASAAAVTYLVDSAPGALDTLNELANALGDDQNFATTVTNALSSKLSISSASSIYQTKDSIASISENYNAQDNETIFVNSASSSINVTLPSSPTTGSKIKVLDVAANAQNNNITILGNGYNIGGASAYIINTPDSSVDLIYINSNKGWNVLNQYVSLARPGIPTGVSATDVGTGRAYNNGAATVSFTAPTSGGAVDLYTVTSTPGNYIATGLSSPIIIEGLQSSTSYTFTVSSSNLSGTSISNSSSSITATTVPQAPTISTVDYGFERLSTNYTAGATGGKAVSAYTATRTGAVTASGNSPIAFNGLTGGTAYTVSMTATNENGTSIASNSVVQTPFTTTGGSITTSGSYRIHTFNGTANFVLTGNTVSCDYLIIAGGGAGGGWYGGGGGAGGYLTGATTVSPASHTMTVGGGGSGVWQTRGNQGSTSSAFSISATGGGGGGGTNAHPGGSGGSGGGSSDNGGGGGAGISGQGNNGANRSGNATGAGGGGAGSAGSDTNGGSGLSSSINGTATLRAGGGGGSGYYQSQGSGGSGGGGGGGYRQNFAGGVGTANTGSGGGGSSELTSANGGSGIVIVRYLV